MLCFWSRGSCWIQNVYTTSVAAGHDVNVSHLCTVFLCFVVILMNHCEIDEKIQ